MSGIAHPGLPQVIIRPDQKVGPGPVTSSAPPGLVFSRQQPHLRGLQMYSEPWPMADSPYIFEIDETNYEAGRAAGFVRGPGTGGFLGQLVSALPDADALLARLVDEYRGRFILAKINTEEQQAIAAQFGIRSIPTVKLFRDGAAGRRVRRRAARVRRSAPSSTVISRAPPTAAWSRRGTTAGRRHRGRARPARTGAGKTPGIRAS